MIEIGAASIATVVWLGILTSISPCPLATNIAATTYIGNQIASRYSTVVAAAAYTLGRTASYILVSALIIYGLFSVPGVSNFLQQNMNRILGPILIATGIFIVDIVKLRLPGIPYHAGMMQKLGNSGAGGAVVLGFLFALTFCPVSAALFFGSVVPLSLKSESLFLLPLCYGIGTAAPVIGFAFIMAYSTRFAAAFFNRLTAVERWLRRITGLVFILAGLYFCLKYIFHVIYW